MTAVSYLRPQAYVAETFSIWGFHDKCGTLPAGRAYYLRDCDSLEDGVSQLSHEAYHKRHMAVKRVNHETGQVILHIFAVKKKAKGERRFNYADSHIIHDFYADPVMDIVLSGELVEARP